MKRPYTLLSALLVTSGLSSQLLVDPVPAHVVGKHAGTNTSMKGESGAPKGTNYYTESWDAGIGTWTVVSGVGSLDWVWTNTGPGPTSSTYPVPPLNTSSPAGWMIIDDDYSGTSGIQAESSIVSGVIDLSAAPPNLKLEFDQYFQEFSDPDVETWVGVTTDGGTVWNEILINEGVGRDGRPNPELVDLDISAWVATGPSTVQLRFRYIATWDYGWQVDNVRITDLPNNDMALLGSTQTDFNFGATGLANIEYAVYPLEQVREMIPAGALKNKGYLAQTGVTLNATVQEPGGASTGLAAASYAAAPGQIDTVSVNGYTPSALGDYDLDFAVTQDQTDEVPLNNNATTSFQVDACIWAQDEGVLQNSYQALGDNALEQTELGNYYDVVNAGSTLYGIAVALHENTAPGLLIYGIVFDIDDAEVGHTEDYEVQASDLNAVGGSTWVMLPLIDPLPLDAGTAYLVAIGGYGGSDQIVFGTSGTSAAQVSLIHYPNIATPNFFYVTRTPMVRALLGEDCMGLGIADGSELLQNASAWPNPFAADATLSFDLGVAANVSLEVRDVTGRTVINEDLGKLGAGNHQHQISGARLSAGAYTWSLIADGQRRSGVIAKN